MEKLQALWAKLTADKVLDADDRAKLEEAGMSKEEAIKRARNEELTVKINGNKAAEEGVGDKITFTTIVEGKEQQVRVPVDKDVKVFASNKEVQKTLSRRSEFVEYRTENNQYIGVRKDGSKQVLEDLALLSESVKADERQKELAESERAKDTALSNLKNVVLAEAAGVAGTYGLVTEAVLTGTGILGFALLNQSNTCCSPDLDDRPVQNTLVAVQVTVIPDNATLIQAIDIAVQNIKKYIGERADDNDEMLKQIKQSIERLEGKFDTECETNADFRKQVIELLNAISSGLAKLPGDMQTYYNDIIGAISTNSTKLDGLIAVVNTINANVNAINKNVTDGRGELKEATTLLLKALGKLGFHMGLGISAVMAAVLANGAKLDRIEQIALRIEGMTSKLEQLITKYGDAGEKLGNTILQAISNLDFNTDVDLSHVEELLNKLIKGQKLTNRKINYLTDYVKLLGCKILTKLNKSAPDYSQQFQTIIDLISNINPTEVDLTKLEQKIDTAITGINNNTELLGKLSKDNDIIIGILKTFRQEVSDSFVGVDAWLELIYSKLPAGGTGGCKCDFEKLMAKLEEIRVLIKDHKVEVEVKGGKCCCKQDGEEVHEGVLGNLEDILG